MDIIHCKDCVFFGTDTYRGVKSYACFYYTFVTLTVPDGFCHKARTTMPTEKELLIDVKSSIISVEKEAENEDSH
jgi:hypothetical protein